MSSNLDSPPTLLVTGCSGYVGRAVVDHLLGQNFRVRGLDLAAPTQPEVDFRSIDLLNADSLVEHCEGVDAILHLAGLPNPQFPADKVFALNSTGTFNIYHAAEAAGVDRVVLASSIHAIGYFFGPKPFALSKLPVGEDHPKFTTDSYSFSKQIAEDIGDYFWRRSGISSASLRFGAGWHNPRLTRQEEISAFVAAKNRLEELINMPAAEAAAAIAKAQATFDELRSERAFEGKVAYVKALAEPDLKLIWMRHTFFSFVDLQDACRAMELALTAEFAGSHPLNVVSPTNILNTAASTLARLYYPELAADHNLTENQSLLSGEQAEAVIGFRAETHPDSLLVE